jgi:hypothetical protein
VLPVPEGPPSAKAWRGWVEDTAQVINVAVPYVPRSGELSDVDLEQVAGGKGSVSRCNNAMAEVGGTGAEITIDATAGSIETGPGAAIVFGLGALATGVVVAGTAIASVVKQRATASPSEGPIRSKQPGRSFAPTGYLHLGHVVNALLARSHLSELPRLRRPLCRRGLADKSTPPPRSRPAIRTNRGRPRFGAPATAHRRGTTPADDEDERHWSHIAPAADRGVTATAMVSRAVISQIGDNVPQHRQRPLSERP